MTDSMHVESILPLASFRIKYCCVYCLRLSIAFFTKEFIVIISSSKSDRE